LTRNCHRNSFLDNSVASSTKKKDHQLFRDSDRIDSASRHKLNMDSVLRQSKAMCPFMKKATAAGLRAMSTATPTAANALSPCGGTMSKLQVLARRCPVMGKAMAVQSARIGNAAGFAGVAAKAGMATYHGHAKTGKAKLHTSRAQEAQAVDAPVFPGREKGELGSEI
jgi:5-aminolevulinate synthase